MSDRLGGFLLMLAFVGVSAVAAITSCTAQMTTVKLPSSDAHRIVSSEDVGEGITRYQLADGVICYTNDVYGGKSVSCFEETAQ